MTLYPKLILDALATVRYPGNGKNIVEAEMVADNLRIDGMKVSFSLIFEKPFMVMSREKKLFWTQYEERFTSMLKLIGEEKRMIKYQQKVGDELFDINYEKINKKLNVYRKASMDYLYSSLVSMDEHE